MESHSGNLFPDENPHFREEANTLLSNGAAWMETQNFPFEVRKSNQLLGMPEEFRVRNLIRAIKHGFIP